MQFHKNKRILARNLLPNQQIFVVINFIVAL